MDYKEKSIMTDLLVQNQALRNAANGFKARCEELEAKNRILEEARENANEACAKWEGLYYELENRRHFVTEYCPHCDTESTLMWSVEEHGYEIYCPVCGKKIMLCSDSGVIRSDGKVCDWKVYGLLGDLGKGVFVYCKEKLHGERMFMPIAWEAEPEPPKEE